MTSNLITYLVIKYTILIYESLTLSTLGSLNVNQQYLFELKINPLSLLPKRSYHIKHGQAKAAYTFWIR